jgi:uncharacterized protein YjbI with pentapeptide repeats
MSRGNFSQADFRDAKLDGINWDGAELTGALFSAVA